MSAEPRVASSPAALYGPARLMERLPSASRAPRSRLTPGRFVAVLGALTVLEVVAFFLGASFGEQPISLLRAFTQSESTDALILFSLRLPRVVLAGMVGAALAASGCALQTMLRNPLADPFILGVSGGAALGATVAIALGLGTLSQVSPGILSVLASLSAPSLFAFAGAIAATFIVFAAAGGRTGETALLTGVVFNAFAAAAITCVKALSAPEQLGELLYWLAGALGHERPQTLIAQGVLQFLALTLLVALSGRLHLLALGDEDARSLGVPVERTRLLLLLATSLSVAGAVALTGLIAFVGLLVPHLLRLWLGPDPRLLLPASIAGGAAFLTLADLGARLLFPLFGTEPPVGVLTALLGGPLFLFLNRRRLAER